MPFHRGDTETQRHTRRGSRLADHQRHRVAPQGQLGVRLRQEAPRGVPTWGSGVPTWGSQAPPGNTLRRGGRHHAILRQRDGPSPFVATDRGSWRVRRMSKATFSTTQPAPRPGVVATRGDASARCRTGGRCSPWSSSRLLQSCRGGVCYLETDPHQRLPEWVSQRSGMLPLPVADDGMPPTEGVAGGLSASFSASPR